MALLNLYVLALVLLGALKRPPISRLQVLSRKSSVGTLCLHPLWVPYMMSYGNRHGGVLGENGVSLECDLTNTPQHMRTSFQLLYLVSALLTGPLRSQADGEKGKVNLSAKVLR